MIWGWVISHLDVDLLMLVYHRMDIVFSNVLFGLLNYVKFKCTLTKLCTKRTPLWAWYVPALNPKNQTKKDILTKQMRTPTISQQNYPFLDELKQKKAPVEPSHNPGINRGLLSGTIWKVLVPQEKKTPAAAAAAAAAAGSHCWLSSLCRKTTHH